MVGPSQLLALSATGDYENFAPTKLDGTTAANYSFTTYLNSSDTNDLHWVVSDEKGLITGSNASEWVIKASSTQAALSSTNFDIKKVTAFGSKKVAPVQAGKAVLFVQNSARKVREFNYFYDVDGFRCTDLTQLAHHITESGIIQMVIQRQPHNLVWCVRTDGSLACMTYERDADGLKVAWHKHTIGGVRNPTTRLQTQVYSIATIPSADGTYDELWMIIRRTLDGISVSSSIEVLSKFHDLETLAKDMSFTDSNLTYDVPLLILTVTSTANPVAISTVNPHGLVTGDKIRLDGLINAKELEGNIYKVVVTSATTVTLQDLSGVDINGTGFQTWFSGGNVRKLVTIISGLSNFNAETVSVWADGADAGDYLVTAGSITLLEAAAVVKVGYAYNSKLKLPRLEAGSRDGTSLGKTKRIHRLGIMMDRSIGLEIGDNFDVMTPVAFDPPTQQNQAPALFTGIKSEVFSCGSDFDNKICIRQNRPGPSTILAILPQMVTQDP